MMIRLILLVLAAASCDAFVSRACSARPCVTKTKSLKSDRAEGETDSLTKGARFASKVADVSKVQGFEEAMKQHTGELFEAFKAGELDSETLESILSGAVSADPSLLPKVPLTELARMPSYVSPSDAKDEIRAFLSTSESHPVVIEGNGKGMQYVTDEIFRNWGRTVTSRPAYTFIPTTKVGLCNLVKWANAQGYKVRTAGYRHSWSSIFGGDGQVMVSLLPIKDVTKLPSPEPQQDPDNELQVIELVGEIEEDGQRKALCKVGSGTTNEMFREWVIQNSRDVKAETWKDWWTVPLNVIMVEITFGGSNGPICHGAGLKTKTLSDLVASIEFVNPRGELQTVDDPELIKAASGCFGMLGLVTSVTLKLDPLTFAKMNPEKKQIALTIPPPSGLAIPPNIDMSGITQADMDAAMAEFVHRCETFYYVEYFWFVSQPKCWINTWTNDGSANDAVDYPSPLQAWIEAAMEYISQLMNMTIFRVLPAKVQMNVMTTSAMLTLPGDARKPTVVPLIDALHFRRGIQNMRVYDMEWEIPIPPLKDDPTKPDWSVCQDAWWAVVTKFYERYNKDENDVPCRLTMEMRVTGDSDVLLAPQLGNKFGTCSIEILTPDNVPLNEWQGFMQQTVDEWLQYKDIDGSYLKSRPHWAKQWKDLSVRGTPIDEYLKDAYKDQIPDFKQSIAAIAKSGGYTVKDLQDSFSTPFLESMFGEVYE